ncbi:MAG: Anti-sigma factor [Phycisphaerales bacterium]|jgi:anti-sigma factor RsiW|nr:Anti-sigma factor [Phycisphaerales bacterium]MDB5305494.1 Anti-sigma factor [Phycisphaerales bacterium]
MNMTCLEIQDRMVEYLSGELNVAEGSEFDRHLEACGACASHVGASRVTLQLSRSAVQRLDDPRPEDVPESLVRAIIAAGHCQA